MIKIFIINLFFLVLTIQANAQNNYYVETPKVFTGGLVLGANVSKVEDIDDFGNYHQIGFNTGGIVHIHFSPTIGVAMELLFSQKGSYDVTQTSSYTFGAYISQYSLKLNYVEVPITFHLTQNKMDYEIGGSYSRIISYDEWVYGDQPVIINPLLNYFNNDDYEFIIGGTYNFYKHYYLNVRWQCSLAPIRPPERLPAGYWFDGQQNNVFNFRLIYMF